jgi:aryl-alcohol dehydrogenase-like predicted oxidoreductase
MRNLKKRRLGKSGIKVSEVGFGLWAAGSSLFETGVAMRVTFV